MKELTEGIEFDPEIQALNSRLLEISQMLSLGLPLDDRAEGARSPGFQATGRLSAAEASEEALHTDERVPKL